MDLRPCKRVEETNKKVKRVEDQSQSSKLLDSLLILILSLLPTKDTFTTSVLSKRWEHLWPSIDSFFFSCKDKSQRKNFISFVDYVLDHSTCSKIKNFHLNFTHLSKYEQRVGFVDDIVDFKISRWVPTDEEKNKNKLLFPISRWLATIVEKNVENIVLLSDSYENDSIDLPDTIYKCSSLITLDLTCCILDKEVVIDWKSLKTLRLNDITLDDDRIVNILSEPYFYGAAILLRASTHVETLNITMATTSLDLEQCAFELGYLAKEHDIHFLSSFEFSNLKNVKVVNASKIFLKEHLEWDYDDLFNFSEFLLKNTKVLEKFVIISR
ncbi:hypothetical protein MTR67_020511 [Solanum verrucosum]|uniref:Uncharacterized protein n=1 Tax=Solanum verrucosum TaxID=315347 RepID=A0AAF0TP89_SOLVR|nr:hypothetical protein MTR67_020511 [Solanum verrucosum]